MRSNTPVAPSRKRMLLVVCYLIAQVNNRCYVGGINPITRQNTVRLASERRVDEIKSEYLSTGSSTYILKRTPPSDYDMT